MPFFAIFLYEWIASGFSLLWLLFLGVPLAVLADSIRLYRFYSTQRVQEVSFYENSCRLRVKNLDREASYSEIREITLVKSVFRFYGHGVRVTFKAGDETLLIPRNPKIRALGTDLYSWLKAKVGTPQPPESSSS